MRGVKLMKRSLTVVVAAFSLGVLALMLLPGLLGWRGVIVLSGSMEPALKAGGIAFIGPVSVSSIRPGDIITYRNADDRSIQSTHRVVEVLDKEGRPVFRTKGDANEAPDAELVSPDRIVGRVRLHLPLAGYVADLLRRRTGFALFMGVPALILVAGEIRTIARELRKPRVPTDSADPEP